MAGLNQCNFIGRCGRNPELRYMPNGDGVATVSIAITEKWNKDGQSQEKTEWIRLVFFKQADLVKQYVEKGSLIYVSGKLQTRSWEKDGEKKSMTEVICNQIQFLSPKKEKKEEPHDEIFDGGPDSDQVPF